MDLATAMEKNSKFCITEGRDSCTVDVLIEPLAVNSSSVGCMLVELGLTLASSKRQKVDLIVYASLLLLN